MRGNFSEWVYFVKNNAQVRAKFFRGGGVPLVNFKISIFCFTYISNQHTSICENIFGTIEVKPANSYM